MHCHHHHHHHDSQCRDVGPDARSLAASDDDDLVAPVNREMNRLGESVGRLEATLEDLRTKLTPVMGEPAEPVDATSLIPKGICELAMRVHQISDRVERLGIALIDVIERVQV